MSLEKYTNFDDFIMNMKKPLDNPDFYALILADDRYSGEAFSMCHEYNLGSTTFEQWYQLISVGLNELVNNVDTQRKWRNRRRNL